MPARRGGRAVTRGALRRESAARGARTLSARGPGAVGVDGAAGGGRLPDPGEAQLADLGGVLVRVGRVEGEPAPERVRALLAVGSRPRPVLRGQPVEQLGGRRVGRADGVQGGLDRARRVASRCR